MAAASDGVATPNMMAPSTDRMSKASGRKDVASSKIIVPTGTLRSSRGMGGASDGLSSARPIT